MGAMETFERESAARTSAWLPLMVHNEMSTSEESRETPPPCNHKACENPIGAMGTFKVCAEAPTVVDPIVGHS
jgi:hypothetical protein